MAYPARITPSSPSMPYHDKGRGAPRGKRNFGDRPSFGKKPSWDRGSRDQGNFDRPALFEATCSECGNACQVPFKPTGRRPVLCTNCFRNSGGDRGGDRGASREFAPRERSSERPTDQSRDIQQLKEQLRTVNEKLDTILELLDGEEE